MSYVDAAYIIVLSVLALYGAGIALRRRRLARAVTVAAREVPPGGPAGAVPPVLDHGGRR